MHIFTFKNCINVERLVVLVLGWKFSQSCSIALMLFLVNFPILHMIVFGKTRVTKAFYYY